MDFIKGPGRPGRPGLAAQCLSGDNTQPRGEADAKRKKNLFLSPNLERSLCQFVLITTTMALNRDSQLKVQFYPNILIKITGLDTCISLNRIELFIDIPG